MLETSAQKSETTPRTRQFLFLLLLMGILMLYYNSSLLSEKLKTWTIYSWLSSSQKNVSAENSVKNSGEQGLFGDLQTNAMTTTSTFSAPPNPGHHQVLTDDSMYYVEYPHQYRFIIDEPHRCEEESPFLVLMIPVAPHNRKARDVIRKTWAEQSTVLSKVVSHYFLLGATKEEKDDSLEQQVLEESQQYHDIIQSNFLDSYKNLTIKTMVMFEWLSSHCPNSFYAMKIDSDIFLNVPNLVNMLLDTPRQLYMTGFVERHAFIIRHKTSKWFLPNSVFPGLTYPPYTTGLGYVFSMDLPKKMIQASAHVKALYIEDVYVGLCMRHLGITISDPPSGNLFRIGMPNSMTKCYWTTVITTIMKDSDQLWETWQTYKNQLLYC